MAPSFSCGLPVRAEADAAVCISSMSAAFGPALWICSLRGDCILYELPCCPERHWFSLALPEFTVCVQHRKVHGVQDHTHLAASRQCYRVMVLNVMGG